MSSIAVCNGFSGNPDLYGLGIRLGIYLQWISSLLTNTFIPTEMSDTLDTNSIFLFALFVAIACATTTSNGLRPSEAFIMLQLCFGYLLSVLSISGLRLTLLNNPDGLKFKVWLDTLKKGEDSDPARPLRFEQLNTLSSVLDEEPPISLGVPLKQMRMLGILNYLTDIRLLLSPTRYNPSYDLGLTVYFAQVIVTVLEYFVSYALDRQLGANESEDDPAQAYVRQKLRTLENKRLLRREINILSLGLKSQFKHDEISWLGITWRSLLVGGIAIYNVWFWFGGISMLASDSCSTYIFLFYKADAYSSAGIFYKKISIFFMVYSGILLVGLEFVMRSSLQAVLRSLFGYIIVIPCAKILLLLASLGISDALERANLVDNVQWDKLLDWLDVPSLRLLLSAFAYVSSNPKEAGQELTAVKKGELSTVNKWLRRFLILAILVVVVWTVVTIELTLVYNSITDVYSIQSTGQLIPFIIGVVSTGRTVNAISLDLIKTLYPKWQDISVSIVSENRLIICDNPPNKAQPAASTQAASVTPPVGNQSLATHTIPPLPQFPPLTFQQPSSGP